MTRSVALCYGTRPQIIKASLLRHALAADWQVAAVDTGQHYDFALHELLYQQLAVAPPDHYLEVGSASHAGQTALILQRIEPLLSQLRPAAAVVIGDTNSTLACALGAAKLRIPVVHVEAGLRAADRLMAEETNRRVSDAVAGLLCAPSAAAADRMRREHPDSMVRETGDIARDVLLAQLDCLPQPAVVSPIAERPYLFATIHRAEVTDDPPMLRGVLDAIGALPIPTILAMHPRTRAALEGAGLAATGTGNLQVIPAAGYREALSLTRGATAVLTDSGGIQREAYWLGVPCVTLRGDTEWPETVHAGANRLVPPCAVGTRLPAVLASICGSPAPDWNRDAYGRGDAAARIAAAIREWLG